MSLKAQRASAHSRSFTAAHDRDPAIVAEASGHRRSETSPAINMSKATDRRGSFDTIRQSRDGTIRLERDATHRLAQVRTYLTSRQGGKR